MSLSTAIGHTRWATHGKVSITNAHPHFDNRNTIAIVHNGIIENYISLKKKLIALGFIFYSETDSEVIANLISHYYDGDFLLAMQLCLRDLEGSFAIAAIHKNFADGIIAASRASPLVIGIATHGTCYLSSDPHAFIHKTNDILFLQDDQIVIARRNSVSLYNIEGKQLNPVFHTLQSNAPLLSKGSYPHYMLKEIFDQPKAITTILKSRCRGTSVQFDELPFTNKEMEQFQRIIFLGCGSSWHAGCLVSPFFEKLTTVPVQSEISSEFRYRESSISPSTLIIAISQSGETADTLAAVRSVKKQGAFVIGVCNVAYSTLTREVDTTLLLEAGPEISVCSTKAFTSQVALLFLLGLYCRKENSCSDNFIKEFTQEFARIPERVLEILENLSRIQAIAKKYSHCEKYFFLGRQYMFPVSLEAALKFKEITYINGVAYPAGEMKHGPLALIDKNTTVIGLCGNNHTYDKMISNIMEVSARKAHVLLIAPIGKNSYPPVDDQFLLPVYPFDELAIFPYIVVMQLFAYYVAVERGCDIDKPRHLAKSVTVEMNNSEKTKKELESSHPSVEKIYDGELISVVKHVISPQNTHAHTYEYVKHPQAVTMIPLTRDGKLILVQQYRYCVGQILLEFPAGNMFPKEDPFVAANRELQEEIGYKAETLVLLESVFSSPGFSDEYLHIFLAKDLTPSQFIAEDTFEIDIVNLTIDEIYGKIKNHEIIDAKTLCGILLFDNWKKENPA